MRWRERKNAFNEMTDNQASDKDGFYYDEQMHMKTDMERKGDKIESNVGKGETGERIVSRHKLSRTPPQRRGSLPEWVKPVQHCGIESPQQEEEEERRQARRKREEKTRQEREEETACSSVAKPMVDRVNYLLKKVDAECKIIAAVAKERNTKKEIKGAAATLTRLMSQLCTSEMKGLSGFISSTQEEIRNKKIQEDEKQNLIKENEKLRNKIEKLENEKRYSQGSLEELAIV